MKLWPWPHNVTELLTTKLVPCGKQRPVDVAQFVCTLVPVHDVLKLTDPDGFFDLSESLIVLPLNYSCPLLIDDMVSLCDKIYHCTFVQQVSDDFRSDIVHACGTYLVSFWCSLGLVLIFLPVFPMYINSQLWYGILYTSPQVFSFSTLFLGWNKAFLSV